MKTLHRFSAEIFCGKLLKNKHSIATFPGELFIEKGVFARLTGDPPEAFTVGVSNIPCSERALIPSDSSHARQAPNGLPVLCASIPPLPRKFYLRFTDVKTLTLRLTKRVSLPQEGERNNRKRGDNKFLY